MTYRKKLLPKFEQDFNSLVARVLNFQQGKSEWFWAPGSYNKLALHGDATTFKYMEYTLLNGVNAGLVKACRDYPGLTTLPGEIGLKKLHANRPDFFFSPDGHMPEEVSMTTTMPKFDHYTEHQAREELCKRVRKGEFKKRMEMKEKGRKFMGARAVCAQEPFSKPKTPHVIGKMNPRVTHVNKWKRIEMIQTMVSFLKAHAEALLLFCAGDRDVVFPYGTYQMDVFMGGKCIGGVGIGSHSVDPIPI